VHLNGKIPLKGSKEGREGEERPELFCDYVGRAELTLDIFRIGLQDFMC
jgi:hypothetical protein